MPAGGGGGFHGSGLWVDEVEFEGPWSGSLAEGTSDGVDMGAESPMGRLTREKMLLILGRAIRNDGIGLYLHIISHEDGCGAAGAQLQHQVNTHLPFKAWRVTILQGFF